MKIGKRPQLISPGSLNRMLQAAQESWGKRDFDAYFETMERASKLDPANHRIPLDLGLAYGKSRSCSSEKVGGADNGGHALPQFQPV
jgi:hypothetical protein